MQPHALTASVVGQRSEDKLLAALNVWVPVDGIHATVYGVSWEYLMKRPELKPTYKQERRRTKENPNRKTVYKEWMTYRGMTLTRFKKSGRILLTGSPHVYANEGLHNADDFTLGRLLWVIHDLRERFRIELIQNKLHVLEEGVNLRESGHTPTDILNSMLIFKTKPLSIFTIKGSDGRLAEIGQHILKAYDKGKQYSDYFGTFRLEDRFEKAEKFNEPFGIVTLADLCQPIKLAHLARHLVNLWDKHIVIFDVALKQEEFLSQFSKRKQVEILRWADPYYWPTLQQQTKGTKHNRYYRAKIDFAAFHAKHSSMKEDVLQAIESKIAPLLALAESPEALRWEELLALAAETETGKVAEVGKNDRFQTPAIIAAREEFVTPKTSIPTQAMGKNDRFGIPSPTLAETEKSQQWENPNEGKEKEGMGRNDDILYMSEFPIQEQGSDWEAELNRPEPFEEDPF